MLTLRFEADEPSALERIQGLFQSAIDRHRPETGLPNAMNLPEAQANQVASILTEALPYIRRFHGWTIVVKYGGAAMVDDTLKNTFARGLGADEAGGHESRGGARWRPADRLAAGEAEHPPPASSMACASPTPPPWDVVEMVLGGQVNQEIVALLNHHGGHAVGVTGKDGGLIRARRLKLTRPAPELAAPRDHRHRPRRRSGGG